VDQKILDDLKRSASSVMREVPDGIILKDLLHSGEGQALHLFFQECKDPVASASVALDYGEAFKRFCRDRIWPGQIQQKKKIGVLTSEGRVVLFDFDDIRISWTITYGHPEAPDEQTYLLSNYEGDLIILQDPMILSWTLWKPYMISLQI